MNPALKKLSRWIVIPLALAPLATSCVVNTGSKHTFTGKSIEDDVLRRLSPGESKEFVLTLFGPPSSKDSVGGGSEVWRWNYQEWSSVQNAFGGVSSSQSKSSGSVNVEFEGRTVVRVWRS